MDIWAIVRLIWGLVACEIGVILLTVILIGGVAGIIDVMWRSLDGQGCGGR